MSRANDLMQSGRLSLLAGARNSLATLGLFGHYAQTAPDVRTAIIDMISFLSVHDRFAEGRLMIVSETATIQDMFDDPAVPGGELAASNAPMAQIAEMLGYSDQTVFSRAFSRHFGRPPSHLRKTRQGGAAAPGQGAVRSTARNAAP